MARAPGQSSVSASRALLVPALLALYAGLVLKNAWMADDAYITLRTVDGLVAGRGMRFNVDERVQTFTNPLWTLVLAAAYRVTHEAYFTSLFVSIATSISGAAWLVRRATGDARVVACSLLVGSKAFVDYSTSGLENPLSHLLLVLFLTRLLFSQRPREGVRDLALLAALAAVNRLDTAVVFAPPLAFAWWRCPRRRRASFDLVVGATPLVAWLAFATIYFGFPLPNTAYAKLGTGPLVERLAQGGWYAVESLGGDPWTLVTVVAGIVAAFLVPDRAALAVAAGIALHLAYVAWIGGDFMSGRFFALPYLAAVVVLVRCDAARRRWILASGGAVLVVSLVVSAPRHLLSGPRHGDVPLQRTPYGDLPLSLVDAHGVCDERAFYFQATGLLRVARSGGPRHPWIDAGLAARSAGARVVEWPSLGLFAFHAGPEVHVIDRAGVADALLARLPPIRAHARPGHAIREIPAGYVETLERGENVIADPALRARFDEISVATRSPLFAPGRLATLWRLNTR
jgi:arabinofuranosyltransferase